jgi:hypothetical protein
MNRTAIAPPLLFALALSGCASTLSGVGGADGYACKAHEGAMCTSVSGVYANSARGMPSQRSRRRRYPAVTSVEPGSIYGASCQLHL